MFWIGLGVGIIVGAIGYHVIVSFWIQSEIGRIFGWR